MPWSTPFQLEIPLPGREPIKTLKDAASYITALPKKEQEQAHWQTAVYHLIKGAELGGLWVMLARIAMLRALNHDRPREFVKRKKTAKTYRIVR